MMVRVLMMLGGLLVDHVFWTFLLFFLSTTL